ncbi:lamin tail domain-containing protein [Chitinophaga sp. Hz27]|uniref:lamin tail domain-containing protein n=1 Tax=Chitinophaga sp. Hz27 TaxID=3347169 RepID=UPI0035DD0117
MYIVGISRTPSGKGYWLTDTDGSVYAFGDATYYGSMAGQLLNKPIVGIAASPGKNGYWLTAADGGVFTLGTLQFYGSKGGEPLNKPVVGIVATPSGAGYWLTAGDGGVFTFGDAPFLGSLPDLRLNKPVVGIAASPTGNGYWLAAGDGGVFSFGDAGFFGSKGGEPLNKPVVGIAVTPTGRGYWLAAGDGGVFSFGDAAFYGSIVGEPFSSTIVGIAATRSGKGYWLAAADGRVYCYGDAVFYGNAITTGNEETTCIILCRFRNNDGSLTEKVADYMFYHDVFLGRHVGGSLRDYYDDVTHGHINITGLVIGWLDIGHTIAEHNAMHYWEQRAQAFNWGIEAARKTKINIDNFKRQVVIINQESDWGGVSNGKSVLLTHTNKNDWSHSRMAHEFGHALGLNEAYNTTGTTDTAYFDNYCIMSYATRGFRFVLPFMNINMEAGPALNGVYVNQLGGIPAGRLQLVPAVGAATTIMLAPLGHSDIPGALLIKIPPSSRRTNTYWVELHDVSKWDWGLRRPTIVIHETRPGDSRSYALETGRQGLESPEDPAIITPDGSVGIRFEKQIGQNVMVRIWELGPDKTKELRITYIDFDPPGDEVANERVVIRNDHPTTVSLKNWILHDSANHPLSNPWTYVFGNVSISPGQDISVWTGQGIDDEHNLYWGLNHAVWNNQGGDKAVLLDNAGKIITTFSYL